MTNQLLRYFHTVLGPEHSGFIFNIKTKCINVTVILLELDSLATYSNLFIKISLPHTYTCIK